MATDDEVQQALNALGGYRGETVLGHGIELGPTGASALPAGAPTGLPAPSGVGGISGFQGGTGRPGGEGGGPSGLGLAKGAIDAARKTGEFARSFGGQAERGDLGGQSLSDALRGISPDALAGLNLPGADLEAIRGLFGGTGTIPSGATLPGMGTSAGQFDIGGSLADVLRSPFQGGPSSLPYTGASDVAKSLTGGVEVPEAIAGASGLAGGLGTAGLGAGAGAAILGLLAQATGEKDLGTAASLLGGGAGLLGTAGSIASGLGGALGGAAAAAAPTVAAGAGALGGAGLGALGGAAGAGFAAPAAALAIIGILDAIQGTDTLEMGRIMRGSAGNYPFFNQELMANQGQQGAAFNRLQAALPYVQNKEELGQLIGEYNNFLGTTQQAPVELYGEGPFAIGKIPGTGPVTHGQQTPAIDWGPRTQQLAQQIADLQGVLPGDMPTAAGRLEGGTEPFRRLWQQFGVGATQPTEINALPVYAGAGQPYQQFTPEQMENAFAQGTFGRTPSWDPSTGQWVIGGGVPSAADYFSVSPYWQQMQTQQAAPAQAAMSALQGMEGFGQLSEEQRRAMGLAA